MSYRLVGSMLESNEVEVFERSAATGLCHNAVCSFFIAPETSSCLTLT